MFGGLSRTVPVFARPLLVAGTLAELNRFVTFLCGHVSKFHHICELADFCAVSGVVGAAGGVRRCRERHGVLRRRHTALHCEAGSEGRIRTVRGGGARVRRRRCRGGGGGVADGGPATVGRAFRAARPRRRGRGRGASRPCLFRVGRSPVAPAIFFSPGFSCSRGTLPGASDSGLSPREVPSCVFRVTSCRS